MKSKVAGIASAAAVVVAILSVALGSTFARAGKQDVVDTAVAAGQFKTLAAALNAAGLVKTLKVVVDTNGLPVQLALTAGEAHDNRLAGKLLSRLKPGTMLLADRGYDADWIRALAAERGAWANIPPKCNRNDPICFSPYLYRARNLIERFFNNVKQCRRVATRYDKLAANYLAFVQLASIRLWLRVNEYTA
jgi:transposase